MAPEKILKYDEKAMELALADCTRGMAVATSAKLHQVPRSTLRSKVKGIYPVSRKMGASTLFTAQEEDHIVNWIFYLANKGFPIQKQNFLLDIKKLANELNKKELKDTLPSKKWYKGFLSRHPLVAERISQNLTVSRSAVTQEKIKNWQNEVQQYLEGENMMNILSDKTRVFNCDETAFFLNPKAGRVLAPRGNKSIYTCAGNDEKENITVLMNGNAAGTLAPSMVVFRYTRIPAAIAESVPSEWGIGRSESGWMNSENFFEYVANIFVPWLEKEKIVKPVIMFLDGHVSHLSLELSRFASEKQIILIALLPNATHLLQPCDVALFHSLKSRWLRAVQRFRMETGDQLKKLNFAKLLSKVIEETYRPEILTNGFRACGLVPWDTTQVKVAGQTSLLNEENNQTTNSGKKSSEMYLKFFWLESLIGREKLIAFKNEQYIETDKGLYEVWITAKQQVLCQQSSRNGASSLEEGELSGELGRFVALEGQAVSLLEAEEDSVGIGHIGATNNTRSMVSETSAQEDQSVENAIDVVDDPIIVQSVATTSKNVDPLVPSPFKRAMFWPGEKEKGGTKRKCREKIPAVVSSADYQLYYERKSSEKKKMEEAKRARLEARQEKKRQKERLKLTKRQLFRSKRKNCESGDSESDWSEGSRLEVFSSSGGEWQEESSDEEIDETSFFNVCTEVKNGDWVLVEFQSKRGNIYYVGIVTNDVEEAQATVKFLKRKKKQYVWPDVEDESIVPLKDIKKKLPSPQVRRGYHSWTLRFPESLCLV